MMESRLKEFFTDYLENICEDTKESVYADRKANEYISKITDPGDALEADWWKSQATYQHEKQGFFGGFMYAVVLLMGGAAV